MDVGGSTEFWMLGRILLEGWQALTRDMPGSQPSERGEIDVPLKAGGAALSVVPAAVALVGTPCHSVPFLPIRGPLRLIYIWHFVK